MPHKLATLIDIRHELLAPGKELRGQWRDLQERDVFLLQYGESDETLREGRLVEAKVRGGWGLEAGALRNVIHSPSFPTLLLNPPSPLRHTRDLHTHGLCTSGGTL